MRTSARRKRPSGSASTPSHSKRINVKPDDKARTFQQKHIQSQIQSNYCKYILYVAIAGTILTTLVLLFSLIKNNGNDEHHVVHLSPNSDLAQVIGSDGQIDRNKLQQLLNQQKLGTQNALKMGLGGLPGIVHSEPPQPNSVDITFRLYSNDHCADADPLEFVTITKTSSQVDKDSVNTKDGDCPLCYSFCGKKMTENGRFLNDRNAVQSIKIISNTINGQIDLYSDCRFDSYHSSIFDFEECVHIWDWPHTAAIKVKRNMLLFKQPLPPPANRDEFPLQEHLVRDGISAESKQLSTRSDVPSYLITYSCESSEYCAFQAQANYYGFLTSGQHPTRSNSLRLLTAGEPDDMASYIPTFTAPRNLYSRRYAPYNKADVLVKWFESPPNRPKEDIIVIIDPDNWIIRDITHWVVKASEGHALGEAAWFHGSKQVTELWKEVCLANCETELDMVGVPYIVHKNDLEKIAPYFKLYITLMKEREERDKGFLNKYKGIQMGWGTEMFGYIFAAAHVGIKHEVVRGIQRRDVSARPNNKQEELGIDMIHMGRAWFPQTYEPGKIWHHTEGKAFSRFGAQVWCKCNYTASDIIPWPLPKEEDGGIDFQSYHTLYLLHYGREKFGPLPSSKYRKPGKRYHEPYP